MLFALKLVLVGAVVLAASFAARRFGHGVAGTLSGMPMIAGPIMGFVLLQAPAAQAHAIAVATLVAYPAMVSHMLGFAHAARRGGPWWLALLIANGIFLLAGVALLRLHLPVAAVCGLAVIAPWVALRLMPAHRRERTVLHIPRVELVLRVAAAVALAASVMLGAESLAPAVSGLMLALPITGNVLPGFTLTRHGADATIELLAGFVRGMMGFCAFFVVLVVALPLLPAAAAYLMAWCVVLALAWAMQRRRTGWTVAAPSAD